MTTNGFDLDEYNSLSKRLLRRLAISPDQLRVALETQKKNPKSLIGEILVDMGACSQAIVDQELEAQTSAAHGPDKAISDSVDDALAALDVSIAKGQDSVRRHSEVMFAAVNVAPSPAKPAQREDFNRPDTGKFSLG